jgi:alpha-beta hydrolase superfamily lysophospholipase
MTPMDPRRHRATHWCAGLALGAAALLAACAHTTPPTPREAAPQAAACPQGTPTGARCLRGQDSAGAHYLIVMPEKWNRVLVVHAHGGPTLGEPKASRADEDIQRWAITVKAGYAWAGSVFRQGGVAVRSAAEDTERVRRIFVDHVAQPRRTLLHGQSWGANVAAKAAEQHAAQARTSPYDAVLLSSGVLAGGTRAYDFRLDLRVVYQYLCNNHPRADEPAYALWMGLPADSKLTRAELASRVDQCLGVRQPAAQRSAEQARKLKTLVSVIRIPESSVIAHLNWATWHFQDIAQNRTGGRSTFGNARVRYQGSDQDDALNAGVLRYSPDPQALATFGADTDLTGRIGVPVLTVHGIHDATAFVEMQSAFRQTMEKAGNTDRLVQVYSDHSEHSYLSDPTYVALFDALLQWVDQGSKPTPQRVADACKSHEAVYGAGCRIMPGYTPPPFDSRVAPR